MDERVGRNCYVIKGVFIVFLVIFGMVPFSNAADRKVVMDNALMSLVGIKAYDGAGNVSSGSGFVLDNDIVVTNYHVLRNSTSLEMVLMGGEKRKRQYFDKNKIHFINANVVKDLALLKVDGISAYISENPLVLSDAEFADAGDEMVVVSNPVGFREFASFGFVGAVDSVRFLIEKRGDLANSDSEFKYKLLYFHNIIKEGSSGAAILSVKNGKVIGVASGAAKKEFAGFGVPVKYVKKLIEKSDLNKIQSLAKIKEYRKKENKNDSYYKDIKKYSNNQKEYVYILRGKVVDGKTPVEKAWVSLYTDEVEGKPSEMSLYTYTDDKGEFNFNVPYIKNKKWKVEVIASGFGSVNKYVSSAGVKNDFKEFNISENKLNKRKGIVFFVSPSSINLFNRSDDILKVKAYKYEGNKKDDRGIKWMVCKPSDNCGNESTLPSWLSLEKREDNAKQNWSEYDVEKIDDSAVNKKVKFKIIIKTNDGLVRESDIYVSTRKKKGPFVFQGLVIPKHGKPLNRDLVKVKVFYDTKKPYVAATDVDQDNHFRLSFYLPDVPGIDNVNEYTLLVDSPDYKLVDNSQMNKVNILSPSPVNLIVEEIVQ